MLVFRPESRAISQIVSHHRGHANQAACAYGHPLLDQRTAADEAGCPYASVAIENGARGDMAMVADRRAMLNKGSAVDDAVDAHAGISIDYGTMHDDAAIADTGVLRHVRMRGNDDRHFKTGFARMPVQLHAGFRRLDLAHRDQRMAIFNGEPPEIIVGGDHLIAAEALMQLLARPNQTGNAKTSFALDNVDAGNGMSPGTDQNDVLYAASPAQSAALLGILIRRAARFSAAERSMRGQPR